MIYMPVIHRDFLAGPGMVIGKVVDSSRPDSPLVDARVCYRETLCTNTDQQGRYILGPLPSGFQNLMASYENYYPVTSGAIVSAVAPVTLNFALTPVFSGATMRMNIVLTWDPTPTWPPLNTQNDLDAHLWLEALIPAHIFSDPAGRGDCTNYPNACLQADYREGYGPESIAIRQLENAKYYYGVLNYYDGYSGVPPITQSSGRVQVYVDSGLLREFQVPASGEGEFWYIFSMDEAGNITETNCIIPLPGEGEYPTCAQPEEGQALSAPIIRSKK
jgi:hypothetical protein